MSTIKVALQWLEVTLYWEALEYAIKENDITDIQRVTDIQDQLTAFRIQIHNLDYELNKQIKELEK